MGMMQLFLKKDYWMDFHELKKKKESLIQIQS